MYLVQILLPLFDNEQHHFPHEQYGAVRAELTERFGGLTVHTRAPAEGTWKQSEQTNHDEIVIFEVIVEKLDAGWWKTYRGDLEARFRQDVVMIRAQQTQLL